LIIPDGLQIDYKIYFINLLRKSELGNISYSTLGHYWCLSPFFPISIDTICYIVYNCPEGVYIYGRKQ